MSSTCKGRRNRLLIFAGLSAWLLAGAERLQPVPPMDSGIPLKPLPSPPSPAVIEETTLEQASQIAHQYFRQRAIQESKNGEPPLAREVSGEERSTALHTESRGPCWFLAPPFLSAENTENQGVYVVKRTGKIYPFRPVDSQFLEKGRPPVYPCQEGSPISADQAVAIANQYYGVPPDTKRTLEYRGDCWFASSGRSDAATKEAEGVYIHKWTGKPCPFYPVDPRFYLWGSDNADQKVTREQARFIWCKHNKLNPYESEQTMYRLLTRPEGDFWLVARYRASYHGPIVVKETSLYVNQQTGTCSENKPGHDGKRGKKGRKNKKKGWSS